MEILFDIKSYNTFYKSPHTHTAQEFNAMICMRFAVAAQDLLWMQNCILARLARLFVFIHLIVENASISAGIMDESHVPMPKSYYQINTRVHS